MNKNTSVTEKRVQIVLNILISLFFIYWVYIQLFVSDPVSSIRTTFSATYGVVALIGGITGLFISRKWGGYASVIGRTVILFSIGLLLQEFGQIMYSYYNLVLNIEMPYPSLGDLGYFSSIVFYISAAWILGRASGAVYEEKKLTNILISVVIPLLILATSMYFLVYKNEGMIADNFLATFLNFGYPIGQAIYIAIGIHVYLLSRDTLGGVMKRNIMFLLFALCVQYLADFYFLYLSMNGLWVIAGTNELMYLLSYYAMGSALLMIGSAWNAIRATPIK